VCLIHASRTGIFGF